MEGSTEQTERPGACAEAEDMRVAIQSLIVKLAERCLSHAHAKEQAPLEPPSEVLGTKLKRNTFPRITAFVVPCTRSVDTKEPCSCHTRKHGNVVVIVQGARGCETDIEEPFPEQERSGGSNCRGVSSQHNTTQTRTFRF